MRSTTERGAPARRWLAGALCALALGACTRDRLELIPASEHARTPPAIRNACGLAEQRCSRCHDLERIQLAHPDLVEWPVYVERMRRMPGSGITTDEAAIIVQCLTWVQGRQRERGLYSYER
ncbi:MAG: hypothetical protein K8M05_04325 [Deltaproteobacteria bacterium]|nr:hypothetical protein [Kofleriaceae bacterium]